MKFFAPFKISENISKTPEGYLLCKNVSIGRTGEMVYGVGEVPIQPGPDGKVFITRSQEELFRPETIASFEGKAITILHPDDFVNPGNWTMLTKGIVQNVRRGTGSQENDLVADLLVTVSDSIELVENGLREVSCGYEAEYTQTGVGRGFQSDIVGNHVALVQEGRAGSSYAINDHKGKGSTMTISEKIKAIFAKAEGEALKAAETKDENTTASESASGFVTMKDMTSYMDTQFSKLMDAFNGGKKDEPAAKDEGAKQDPQTGKPAEVKAKDEPDMTAMLAKIEARLAKLEGAQSGGDEAQEEVASGDEDPDNDGDDDDKVGDESEEDPDSKTGDSASGEDEDESLAARVEILAPGMKIATKDVKSKALLAAYATEDGKNAIHKFTGGKAPNVKNKATCDALFVGVSEILKLERSEQLAASRPRVRDTVLSSLNGPKGTKSAEDINEINAKHYGAKK